MKTRRNKKSKRPHRKHKCLSRKLRKTKSNHLKKNRTKKRRGGDNTDKVTRLPPEPTHDQRNAVKEHKNDKNDQASRLPDYGDDVVVKPANVSYIRHIKYDKKHGFDPDGPDEREKSKCSIQ